MADVSTETVRDGAADPEFLPSEQLYRRFPADQWDGESVSDAAIPFPTFCVNRGKYSKPEDVIRDHPAFGIAAFLVVDIPTSLKFEESFYKFVVEHRPEPGNYSHTEVYSQLGENRVEPPRSLRKRFRNMLRERLEILRPPI